LVIKLPYVYWAVRSSVDLASSQVFLKEPIMDLIRRVFHVPATETQTGIVLALCIFAMSVMSIVLVWQAQVIAKQNAVIHMFETRLGSWHASCSFRNIIIIFYFFSPSFLNALCFNFPVKDFLSRGIVNVARLFSVLVLALSFSCLTTAQESSAPVSTSASAPQVNNARHHSHHSGRHHGKRHHGKHHHASHAANP
jgi:hypothetical protein